MPDQPASWRSGPMTDSRKAAEMFDTAYRTLKTERDELAARLAEHDEAWKRWSEIYGAQSVENTQLTVKLEAATARIGELEGALERYGDCEVSCRRAKPVTGPDDPVFLQWVADGKPCTCGFKAAQQQPARVMGVDWGTGPDYTVIDGVVQEQPAREGVGADG